MQHVKGIAITAAIVVGTLIVLHMVAPASVKTYLGTT